MPRVYVDTGDEQAVQDAWAIMDATINDLTLNGGLRESCETATQNTCNADQQSFKGITMYYMYVSSFLISHFQCRSGFPNPSATVPLARR